MHINEEYRILRDFSSHPNLPDFLGVYRKKGDGVDNPDEIWFILEVRRIHKRTVSTEGLNSDGMREGSLTTTYNAGIVQIKIISP